MQGSTAVPAADVAGPSLAGVFGEAGPLPSACPHTDPDRAVQLTLLYDDHHQDVWNLARFWLRTAEDAEDAVQDTFLRAHRALRRGSPPHAPRPWLMAICRNVCHDRRRSRHRRQTVPLDLVHGTLLTAEEDQERRLDIRTVLAGLAPGEQEAFFLVDVLGLHSDEAAAVLGLRASSTLRSRLARARAAVASAMRDAAPTCGVGPEPSQIWGLLHAPPARAVVLAAVGVPLRRLTARVRTPEPTVAGGAAPLLRFLDGLDRQLPAGVPLVAVVDETTGEGHAERWTAGRPRWELRHAGRAEPWLGTVHGLLGSDAERALDHERMRRLLDDATPFVWTYR